MPGPLGGIESALAAASTPLLLVLAVDMPCLTAEILHRLRVHCAGDSGVIPRVTGRIEPLAGFYPRSAQPLAETLLRDGFNAATHFAERCVQSHLATFHDLAESEGRCFDNWNTPADVPARSSITGSPARDGKTKGNKK